MNEMEDPADLTETINCPNCGGVATYRRGAFSALCPYCGRSIPTPVEQHARLTEPRPRQVEPRARPPLRSSQSTDFWKRYPPQPARPTNIRRRSRVLALTLVLFVGLILGINWLASRPPGIPTPTPQPTNTPWPTAVPPTAAPSATPLSPLLSVMMQFSQRSAAPYTIAPPARLLLITRYTGAGCLRSAWRSCFDNCWLIT